MKGCISIFPFVFNSTKLSSAFIRKKERKKDTHTQETMRHLRGSGSRWNTRWGKKCGFFRNWGREILNVNRDNHKVPPPTPLPQTFPNPSQLPQRNKSGFSFQKIKFVKKQVFLKKLYLLVQWQRPFWLTDVSAFPSRQSVRRRTQKRKPLSLPSRLDFLKT